VFVPPSPPGPPPPPAPLAPQPLQPCIEYSGPQGGFILPMPCN
jgi:hypothetical protein